MCNGRERPPVSTARTPWSNRHAPADRDDGLVKLPDGVGNVADDFVVREVDLVDLGRVKVDVDDLLPVAVDHEERRLLDHVVADVDDQIG